MDYNVSIEKHDSFIRVEVSGTRIKGKADQNGIDLWKQILETCQNEKISRVLLILNLIGPLPMMASYKIATAPNDFGWSRSFKVAVVDSNEESRESNFFAETVATNRGYWVKLFEHEDDATTWLLHE